MNSLEISPNALASLVAIADHGSMSAAARYRSVTQPSLSRQIQELEQRLQTQLVERSANGTSLTPAGMILVEKGREIIAMLGSLPEQVKSQEGKVSGTVRLGCIESIGIYTLPPILSRFIDENPLIDVQVICQSSPNLLNLLLTDELDAVIGTFDSDKVNSEILYRNRLVLAYPSGTPATKIPRKIQDIKDSKIVTFPQPLTIRRLLDQACHDAGFEFEPIMELANVEAIKAMVRSGLGYAFVPEGCVHGFELETAYIDDLKVGRTIRLLYRSQSASLATNRLLDALRTLRDI